MPRAPHAAGAIPNHGGASTGGLTSVLAMIGAQGRVDVDDGDQAEMFEADGAMPSMMPGRAPARSGEKGGRPRGARNKSTEAWRELFLSKYRHPLMALGELTTMTPEQLAREMKLYVWNEGKQVVGPKLDALGRHLTDADGNKLWEPVLATGEAFKRQMEALTALLPYLGQKLPLAIEQKGDQRGLLVVGDLTVNNAVFQQDQLPLADPIDVTPAEPRK